MGDASPDQARLTSPARVASTVLLRSESRWRTISCIIAVFMPAACRCARGFLASTAPSYFASLTRTTRGNRKTSQIRTSLRTSRDEARELSSTTKTVFP